MDLDPLRHSPSRRTCHKVSACCSALRVQAHSATGAALTAGQSAHSACGCSSWFSGVRIRGAASAAPLLRNHISTVFAVNCSTVPCAAAAPAMVGTSAHTCWHMLAVMHHRLSGLCVTGRRVVAVARATEATRRNAHNRKVVKLARVPPIAACACLARCACDGVPD